MFRRTMDAFRSFPLAGWLALGAVGCSITNIEAVRDSGLDQQGQEDGPSREASIRPDRGPAPDSYGTYQGSFPTTRGEGWGSLTIEGVERSVALYRPAQHSANPPLVIVFHGTSGDGRDAIEGSAAKALADAQGVIIAAPSARALQVGDWDNHVAGQKYWETFPAVDPVNNNDLQLVQATIDAAHRAYGVDLRRVYSIGFSSGGFFSLLVAMSLPDQIAAFAEASAGLVHCDTTASCTFVTSATSCATMAQQPGYCRCDGDEKPTSVRSEARKPPGYLTHGNSDGVVSSNFTCALALRMQELGYPVAVDIRTTSIHGWPENFATKAWAFLSKHTLP